MSPRSAAVPLPPRRRVAGGSGGALRSSRRGPGADFAGLRPYRPGDDYRRIDHGASARLSAVTGRDELLVREHFTEEATRVLLVVDESPSMALYPDELPWLRKPAAVAEARRVVAASAESARCPLEERSAGEPPSREPPAGSFVFVLSDFLDWPGGGSWLRLAPRLDVVPVVIEDPVWEQSFPEISGALLPIGDPASGRVRTVRLTRAETLARRRANEVRLAALLDAFASLGLDWVLIGSHRPADVLDAFAAWARGRLAGTRLAR